jgi:hypothetical protein
MDFPRNVILILLLWLLLFLTVSTWIRTSYLVRRGQESILEGWICSAVDVVEV